MAFRPIGYEPDGRPKFASDARNVWLMLVSAAAASIEAGTVDEAVGDIRCIMRSGEVEPGWRIELDGRNYEVEGAAPARQWDRRAFDVVSLRLIRSTRNG